MCATQCLMIEELNKMKWRTMPLITESQASILTICFLFFCFCFLNYNLVYSGIRAYKVIVSSQHSQGSN